MDHLLTVTPVWAALILFAVVPAVIVVLLHDWFRRKVPAEVLLPHHDVAGFLVAVVGLLFAVVLAFLVAAAWGDFDASQRNADSEASDVAESFASATVLHEPTRSRVRSLLADYAFEVRDKEWGMLVHDAQDFRARAYLVDAYESVASAQLPRNATVAEALEYSSVQNIVTTNLENLSSDRRRRLLDAARHIPAELYLALLMGWAMLTAFVFLFGCSRALQLTMTALVTGSIGLLFGVVVEFDRPYSHGIRVSDEAWTLIIHNNNLARYRTAEVPTVP